MSKSKPKPDHGWAIYDRDGNRISDVSRRITIMQSGNWVFKSSNSGWKIRRVTITPEGK